MSITNVFASFKLNSIRTRLFLGFGIMVALLLAGGFIARSAFNDMSERITQSLADVERESQLAGELSSNVAKTLEAGSRYLDTRDSSTENAFRKSGWAAHEVQRRMNEMPGQNSAEVAIVASIDNKLSAMEVQFALAHRLTDLGRMDEARRVAGRAQDAIENLLNSIQRLNEIKTKKVEVAQHEVTSETRSEERRVGKECRSRWSPYH